MKNNTGTIYVSSISSKLICNPKGHSSLVLVGMCRSGIWQQTHTNTNFSRKSDPFNMPIGPILRQILNKITKFSKDFFGSHLGKFWKIEPFIYKTLHFIRGHLCTKRLILLPMLVAHPRRVFCTEYPLAVIIDQIYTVESVFSNWTPFLPPLCTL